MLSLEREEGDSNFLMRAVSIYFPPIRIILCFPRYRISSKIASGISISGHSLHIVGKEDNEDK